VPGLLSVALALFLVAGIVLTFNLNRLQDSFAWVAHTNEVLRSVSAVEWALLQAESGERGYLLTGGNSYRDSYVGASAEIPQLLETLKGLVSDNPVQGQRQGCGIAPDLMSKLFQPFVTTKQTGLGIGLSLSRAIIDSHGGQITAEPNPDGGTIFRFTLRGIDTGELDEESDDPRSTIPLS
jgi:CHASE3 domain/Histidine kinase-, DNA gyrase B-, and HSP90-like ATPase